jgi:hypothetical protein
MKYLKVTVKLSLLYTPPGSPESTTVANVVWAVRTARIKLASEFYAVKVAA